MLYKLLVLRIMKKIYLLIASLILVHITSAQVTYNSYANISNISGTTLTVTNLSEAVSFSFAPSVNVLIMQMQDDVIGTNTTNASTFGDLGANQSAGRWEQKTVSSITRSGTTATIVLSAAPTNSYNVGANSSLQIISFPLLNPAAYTTTNNITGTAWNGTIGGVVAFEVGTTLTLNNNISANALGFRGGTVSANHYPGGTTCDTIANTWRQGSNIRGQKGEGIYKITDATFQHGKAKILNGGGGGGNINAGGGGGGNWTTGGDGGPGWNGTAAGCTGPGAAGRGGISLATIIPLNRIFMGGGGGGGQQNNSAATAGGRGGGIVVVKAGTLVTTGTCASPRIISANGQIATTSGNDGTGGSGAGGSVVLQINSFNVLSTCQLSITANGANGGTVNTSTHAGGGGGGQGIVVFSIPQPTTNITTQTSNGNPGCNNNSSPCNNTTGSVSGTSNSGIIPNIGGPLPIELLSFSAKKNENQVNLTWITATELLNEYFTIERSADGINFVEIEKVKSKALNGTSKNTLKYSIIDYSPFIGLNYYRLKQTDFNGDYKYSNLVFEIFDGPKHIQFSIYPNPNNGEFTVDFSGVANNQQIEIQLVDVVGKLISKSVSYSGEGSNSIKISPESKIKPGIYFCQLTANGVKYSTKVLIQ